MATLYLRFLALLPGKRLSAHVADARTVFVPELHKACITLDWPDGVNLKHIDGVECVDGRITIVATMSEHNSDALKSKRRV
jgi:hypothetical protein